MRSILGLIRSGDVLTLSIGRHPSGCVLFALFLLVSAMPVVDAHDHNPGTAAVDIEFYQSQGAHMLDTIHLNGSSNVPLRNASWSVVNISGATPTTVVSGPYLTAVMPLSEHLFAWNLTVEVPGLACTCYVSIELEDANDLHRHYDILLYLGEMLHRPVFVGEWRQHLSPVNTVAESNAEVDGGSGQQPPLLVSDEIDHFIDLVLAPDSGTISMVMAELCEAPNGVCLESPITQTLPHELVNSKLMITLNASNMTIEEGIWKMVITATDSLLRTTGQHQMLVVYDGTPPVVDLITEQTTFERVPINVYVNAEDGYTGADFTYTWTLVDELGSRRAPTTAEYLAPNHLLLNLSSQGVYVVEVSVRDLAGLTADATENFTVINQRPTARISNEGMIFSTDGRLMVQENDGWSITGNLSYDDEPVEYLWVVNDDRSWRGLTALNQEHFEGPGTYTVELIVFDDDGATNSTFLELEILAYQTAESSTSTGWVALLILVFILGLGLGLSRRSVVVDELPKWTSPGKQPVHRDVVPLVQDDATVEEDEPHG